MKTKLLNMTLGIRPDVFVIMNSVDAFFDSSSAFEIFLEKEGEGKVTKAMGMRRKKVNTIVPHVGSPIKTVSPATDHKIHRDYMRLLVHISLAFLN
jgi:hypothetical protein